MNIAGIIKSSFIEYPGKASTVVFFGGCNFRCGYCHNPALLRQENSVVTAESVFQFLEKRRKFIDALCVTGGEPTLQSELPGFLERAKRMGLSVKLDTNGTNAYMIERLIRENLVDHLAMDIKAPRWKYAAVVNAEHEIETIFESAKKISQAAKEGRITAEFRTTVCKEQLSREDIGCMIAEHENPPPWYLQRFRNPGEILDQKGTYSAYTELEMKEMGEQFCVNVR